MTTGIGKRMAELQQRFNSCKEPYLTNEECIELRDWLREAYEYNHACHHGINAIYFSKQHENMARICDSRGI